MELALCLEKLTNEKLLNLHSVSDADLWWLFHYLAVTTSLGYQIFIVSKIFAQVADRCNDAQLTDFIESEFLEEQVRHFSYLHIWF